MKLNLAENVNSGRWRLLRHCQLAMIVGLVVFSLCPLLHAGDFVYSIENRDTKTFIRRGHSSTNGLRANELILRENTRYRYWLYDVEKSQIGFSEFTTPAPGSTFSVPPPAMGLPVTGDTDGDGLADEVELFVTGSSITNPDTDGDGIQDGAALKLGFLDRSLPVTGVIGSVAVQGTAVAIAGNNDLVVVGSEVGVFIFNVFNRMNPVLVAQVTTPEPVAIVAIAEGLVVASVGEAAVVAIDITDPPNARILRRIDLQSKIKAIHALGSLAYVGLASGEVVSVDLSSGTVLESINLGTEVDDLTLVGDDLYVLTRTVLSIRKALGNGLPLLGEIEVRGSVGPLQAGRKLFVGGGVAYVGHNSGYSTVNVSNSAQPKLLGQSPIQQAVHDIEADGSGKILTVTSFGVNSNNLEVSVFLGKDPSIVTNLESTFDTPGIAYALQLYNGLSYVASGQSGLQVLNYASIDVSNKPPTISLSGSWTSVGDSNGFAEEQKWLRATASVADDVQVRNVEFYVDGVKVSTDGNFPFEWRFLLPALNQRSSIRIRARASDTGGNAAWSQEWDIALTKDTTPPQVIGFRPQPGTKATGVDSISFYGSEPLDESSVSSMGVSIESAGPNGLFGDGDDLRPSVKEIRYQSEVSGVVIQFEYPLSAGKYRVVLAKPLLDRAGNATTSAIGWDFAVLGSTTIIGLLQDESGSPLVEGLVSLLDKNLSVVADAVTGRFKFSNVLVEEANMVLAARFINGRDVLGAVVKFHGNPDGTTDLGSVILRPVPSPSQHRLAAGGTHLLAIRPDGTLWGAGENSEGQLGTAQSTVPYPSQITTNSNWEAVSAGYDFSLALDREGRLWSWGDNSYGQLANGLSGSAVRTGPKLVDSAARYSQLVAGPAHALAIRMDGSLWSWGYNGSGQLGIGSKDSRNIPTQVGLDRKWKVVGTGGWHSVAVAEDGTLWSWGENLSGELGDGSLISKLRPVQVGNDSNWWTVAVSGGKTLALRKDGSLWAWGWAISSNTIATRSPILLTQQRQWVQLAANDAGLFALRADGQIWTWRGFGKTATETTIAPDLHVHTIAASGDQNHPYQRFLAISDDGTMWQAFSPYSTFPGVGKPIQIGTSKNWVACSSGGNLTGGLNEGSSLGIQSDGSVWAWGEGTWSIGCCTGAPYIPKTPSKISTVGAFKRVSWGTEHGYALGSDGSLWGIGWNDGSQLGFETTDLFFAVYFSLISVNGDEPKWTQVAAGGELGDWPAGPRIDGFGVGIRADGSLWSWGGNGSGQLGDGTFSRSLLHKVDSGIAWSNVAAGESYVLGLDTQGHVYSWGANQYGCLGLGVSSDVFETNIPTRLTWGQKCRSIHAEGNAKHSFAIASDGSLWAWGKNDSGQLGIGSTQNQRVPVPVPGVQKWKDVSVGRSFTIAISDDDTLWAWGDNSFGQLGDESFRSSLIPIQVSSTSKWQSISAGHVFANAVRDDGTLWGWGERSNLGTTVFGEHEPLKELPGGSFWDRK